jgi:hypothetical protein
MWEDQEKYSHFENISIKTTKNKVVIAGTFY